ncbi:glutathione peroxidase [Peptoniphilus mikwangii]|uniref:glutathione peroxidase n=1 Tax=Peptoniphilus mikwangii TaxID=1354300 RepID=UPI0003FFA022|nr:glutathione peroxidase [Peptoniphilus mikwangii]
MIYDFKVKDTFGEEVSLREYDGYVMLIVNTASKCGFTPQFEGLELLYQKYKDKKFVIIGFPCNQFGNQDLGSNEEIRTFCSLNYGVSFPMMAKIDVNGENQAPLYKYLKSEKRGALLSSIKWNFTKFLIDRNGNVVERFAPTTTPEKLESEIENLL